LNICPAFYGRDMKGFIFRIGERIKNFGERLASVPGLRIFCGPVIGAGLGIKGFALNMTVEGM
jgi:hypothetical protein